jgi:hypothetical protein
MLTKDITKILTIGILFLFLSSPIRLSTSTSTIKPTESTIQTSTNPKIMEILEKVNETVVRGFLEELVAIGPRLTGTYGCEKAAEYIHNQFEEMGLETRYHTWRALGPLRNLRLFISQNVEATLPGIDESNDEIIIFNAHYDTVKKSPGANDDGSGVAAVLTAAYILSQYEFNRTIRFVTFSGEEINLLGSYEYVKDIYENNDDIFVEFNADMIGYTETDEGGKRAGLTTTLDAMWMTEDIKEISSNYNIGLNLSTYITYLGGERKGSDHYFFVQYGYESIAFWESEWNRTYFHTPEDTLEHVNFTYLTKMTKLIIGSLAHLADIENEQPQITIANPRKGALYFEDRKLKDFRDLKTMVIDDILICTEITQGDSPIDKVEFYYDDKLEYTDEEAPYQWRLNKLSLRKHTVTAIVYDEEGKTANDQVSFYYYNFNKKR